MRRSTRLNQFNCIRPRPASTLVPVEDLARMTTAPSRAAATRPATVTHRGPILRSLTSNTASRRLFLHQAGIERPPLHQQTLVERPLKEFNTTTQSLSSAAASVRLLKQVVPSMTMSSQAVLARRRKNMKRQRRQLMRMHSPTLQTSWTTWRKTQVGVTVVSMTAPTPTSTWKPSLRDWTTRSFRRV